MLQTTQQPAKMAHPINNFISDAIEILPGNLSCGVILMCEHASNHIPRQYDGLGLSAGQLERHIAYDIGAAAVTRRISEQLGIPAIMTRYSRLLIDPNRSLDDPTLVMQISDGAIIPGNAYISQEETEHRVNTWYAPYHTALSGMIDAALDIQKPPMLISVHSFTDRWKRSQRPWKIGILWDKDPRLPTVFLQELAQLMPPNDIGDNEPYSGRLIKDSMYSHGTLRGLSHALLELRQDLVMSTAGQDEWASLLTHIIQKIITTPEHGKNLNLEKSFGSYIF